MGLFNQVFKDDLELLSVIRLLSFRGPFRDSGSVQCSINVQLHIARCAQVIHHRSTGGESQVTVWGILGASRVPSCHLFYNEILLIVAC